jgi:hypothetical protein
LIGCGARMESTNLTKIVGLMVCQIDCFTQHYQANIEYTSSLNSKLKKFLDIKQKFNELVKKEGVEYSGGFRFFFSRYCNLVVDLLEGIENEIVREYFPILSNALKFINNWLDNLSAEKKQAILHEDNIEFSNEDQSSFDKISRQIMKNYIINNLLMLLKKVNENELRDSKLIELLASINLKASGISVDPHDNLTDRLAEISQASFSCFRKIQATLKSSPVFSEEKRKIFERISALFASLEQEDPKLLFILSELKQLSLDYDKFLSYENTISQRVTEVLKLIQTCVDKAEWNRKAKYTFAPPQGIRDIRKLLKDKKLSDLQKLVALRKLISKKHLTNSSRRNTLTRNFYENVATNLQAIYDNLDLANKKLWDGGYSDEQLRLTWITEKQAEQLIGIFKELENATGEITLNLQRPYDEVYAKVKEILTARNSNTAETDQFERFRKKLQTFKQKLFSPEWNKKGIGVAYLYRKLPQGIKALQSLYSDRKLEFLAGEEGMTPAQLIYLIRAILQTYAILQQRVISPSSLRDTAVQGFYASNYAYFRAICVAGRELLDENQSQDLSRELRTLFNFISACEGESTASILTNLGLPASSTKLSGCTICYI